MEETTTTTPEPKEKQKRLTTSEWAEICSLWEIGDVTLDFLSNKYGISKDAIWRGLDRRGVQKGSKAGIHRDAVASRVAEEAATNVNEIAKRIKSTKDDYYKYAEQVSKVAMNELVRCIQSKQPIHTVNPTFDTLKKLMTVLRDGCEIRWKVLELDKEGVSEDDLPELVIRELTQDEIQQIQNFKVNEDDLLNAEDSNELSDVIEEGDEEDNE